MASKEPRRRKRRSDVYRAPVTRRAAREQPTEHETPTRPAARRPSRRDRPPSPWGRFPLVEIVIVVALVLLVVGFFMGGTRGGVMLVAGVALGSLAALELTLREHFAGEINGVVLKKPMAAAAKLVEAVVVKPPPSPLARAVFPSTRMPACASAITARSTVCPLPGWLPAK